MAQKTIILQESDFINDGVDHWNDYVLDPLGLPANTDTVTLRYIEHETVEEPPEEDDRAPCKKCGAPVDESTAGNVSVIAVPLERVATASAIYASITTERNTLRQALERVLDGRYKDASGDCVFCGRLPRGETRAHQGDCPIANAIHVLTTLALAQES